MNNLKPVQSGGQGESRVKGAGELNTVVMSFVSFVDRFHDKPSDMSPKEVFHFREAEDTQLGFVVLNCSIRSLTEPKRKFFT